MKRFKVIFHLIFFLIATSVLKAQIPLGDAVKKFPIDIFSTPVGMAINGKTLFFGDLSTSKISALDIESGKIIMTFDAPTFNLNSITYDGRNLWILDKVEKKVFCFDYESGLTLSTLPLDLDEPQSITSDGKNVFIVDGATKSIAQIDTYDGTTFKTIKSPLFKSPKRVDFSAMAFDGKYLWVADRISDEIYQIDTDNEWVINIIKSPGPYTSGIAFIEDEIVVLDYQKREIGFYKLPKKGKAIRYKERKETLTFGETYRNFGPGMVENLEISLAIPENLIFQDVDLIEINPKNYKIEEDEWGQKCAVFNFAKLSPLEVASTNIKVNCTLYSVSYFIDPDEALPISQIPKGLESYLKDDTKLQINNKVIQDAVKEALKGETNTYKAVRKIYDYIHDKMHYELSGGWNVAPVVLKRGSGSCSEYSFVMIAMLRASGIPARYAGSVVIRGDDASRDDVFHRWVEAYIPPFGFIPVDPSGGDSEVPLEKAKFFGSLENRFLITTVGGGNSRYLKWDYNSHSSFNSRGVVKLYFLKAGDWQPLPSSKNEKEITENPPSKGKSCAM